jgi:aminopeptidase N
MPILSEHLSTFREDFANANSFGGEYAEDHYPPDLSLEPLHLDIELTVDIARELAAGVVTHTIRANQGDTAVLTLDAVDFQDVSVEGLEGLEVQHSYDGEKLQIRWGRPFAKGEERRVSIRYQIEKPATGLFFMKPTEADPEKAIYAATDHETERARYWLPCIDLPNVRTTLEFRLTARKEYTILANGVLVQETEHSDGMKTAQWRLAQRCPSYLVCFAIGQFVRKDHEGFEGLPIASFSGPDFSPEDLERTFGKTAKMLDWMTKRLGTKYPYPKYFQFALPAFSGAMENISLVSWNDYFVCTKESEHELGWLTDQVNVHEMAHAFFGDLVGCRDFAHAWLKESWATYIESCWLEDQKGRDEQLYDLWRHATAYFTEADGSYSRPIVTRRFASSWQMYDNHLYPGGACRLHTLRNELGDTVFWSAVADYLSTYHDSVVETDDFRRILEKHSGRALQKLFDQWFGSPGYPDLKVTFTFDAEKKCGTFEIIQKQAGEGKNGREFELKTDLGWSIDGKDHTRAIHLSKARQSFTIPMDSDPEQVRFDPMGKALHKLELDPGDTRLKKQLTDAQDVIGRIQAAQTLCSKGKRSLLRAVVEAYRKEPFWGVRREMLKALADSHSEEGLVGLLEASRTEMDHLVLARVFASLAQFRDPRVKECTQERLAKNDLPPGARVQAYYALGAQRDDVPADMLKKYAEGDKTPHRQDAVAAWHALGMSRNAMHSPYLLEKSRIGEAHFRMRRGAVLGMAALAPTVEARDKAPMEDRLIDLLRDPDHWMRLAAAQGLKNARVRRAIPQIQAYAAGLSRQERVVVERIVKDLSKDQDRSAVAGLDKAVDELKAKVRKLQDRLEDLEDRS